MVIFLNIYMCVCVCSNCIVRGETFQEFPILRSNKNLLCWVTMEMTGGTMTLEPSNNLLFHGASARDPLRP